MTRLNKKLHDHKHNCSRWMLHNAQKEVCVVLVTETLDQCALRAAYNNYLADE